MRKLILCLALCAFAVGGRALAESYDLEIITPHNDQIQEEFERGFVRHLGRPVKVRWIKQGTGEILKLLEAKERDVQGGSLELDVFFGGGVPDHDLAASKGYLEPANVPAEILAGIPEQIAGVSNYDAQKRWIGAALSSFGILVNTRGLASQNLPPVTSWADLADPRMFGRVSIADPRKSASVRVSYELILQQNGWEKGWTTLMQIAANSRTISASSSAIPNDVASGDVLAGPAIDFYALARIAQTGPEVLGYVNPADGTAITPDPISMLRKPPHRELAERFIAFVLSEEGQRLWVLPPGQPGGPEEHALYRLPVRPDVCEKNAVHMRIPNPYAQARAGVFKAVNDELSRKRNMLLADLMGTALVDQHAELKAAWKALIDGGMKPAALAEWNKPPFSEAEALELSTKLAAGGRETRKITRDFHELFKAKYERVKQLSR